MDMWRPGRRVATRAQVLRCGPVDLREIPSLSRGEALETQRFYVSKVQTGVHIARPGTSGYVWLLVEG